MGILIFAFVLSVLIVFHEWGHYQAARCLGIRVEAFSLGFGPVLAKWKWDGTQFCLSLFPLGGYVKLAGESPEESKGEPWEFYSRPNWHKFIVVAAGPILNALLAFVIFAGVGVLGQPILSSSIGEVAKDYPAAIAGLQSGDKITELNGQPIQLWEEVLLAIRAFEGDALNISVERKGDIKHFVLRPKSTDGADMMGRKKQIPVIGILPSGDFITVKYSFFQAIKIGFMKVVQLTSLILTSLWLVITGAVSFKQSMAGPIGIYVMTQQAASFGIANLFDFMGRLSVSLFVINLLPVPVLDGGHLFFISAEMITRRKISDKIKDMAMRIGLVLILSLTVFVLYQDFIKFEILDKVMNVFAYLRGLFNR